MGRTIALTALVVGLVLVPCAVAAAPAGVCQFTGGFRALRDALPAQVGDCLEDPRVEPTTGNTLQRTSGGLLVWRPTGNWTAFTDGYRTWIIGPFGLQQRLSTERFDWEDALAPAQPVAPIQAPPPPAAPVALATPTAAPPVTAAPPSAASPGVPAAQPPPGAPSAAPPGQPTPFTVPVPSLIAPPAPAIAPPAAAPVPASCLPAQVNDDASRALALTAPIDGVLPAAQWSRSGELPDRVAYRYFSFNHSGSGAPVTVALSVGDEGGYKVRANVYAPDATLIGEVVVGGRERGVVTVSPNAPGTYVVQLSTFRPADVSYRIELLRA